MSEIKLSYFFPGGCNKMMLQINALSLESEKNMFDIQYLVFKYYCIIGDCVDS